MAIAKGYGESFKIPEPLAGQFEVLCIGADLRKNGTKQLDTLILTLSITDGPEDSEGNPTQGRMITDFIITDLRGYVGTKGYDMMRTKLILTGQSFGVDLSSESSSIDDFIDKKAIAILSVKPNRDGVLQSQVSAYKPVEDTESYV